MKRGRRAQGCMASVAIALALASASAMADVTKVQCIEANTKGQDLRREGKLLAARDQFRACGVPSCPALVRDDCNKRLDELERAQPGIIFDARNGAGRDLGAVKVTMDGRPLTEKLDGTAVPVDPGEHVFVFTVPDQPPVTQTLVLKEGDKARRERVVIGPSIPTVLAPPLGGTPAAGESGGGAGTVVGLIVGGVGVAGLAVGGAFAFMANAQANQQQTDCPPTGTCNYPKAASDHENAKTDRTIAIAGFAAGGALLLGGAVLFFAFGHSSEPSAATGILVVPSVVPGGGGVSLSAGF